MQDNNAIAVVVMLVSSACYALSYVLQHKGTQASIGESVENPGIGRLIKNPVWIFGIVLFGTSFLLHMIAISFGSVSVVQPLIVTELIFIPPFSAIISKAKIHARDWYAIIAVSVGLAVFLIVGAPTEGNKQPSSTGWIVTFFVFYAICGLLLLIGSRLRVNLRAAVFGTAVGVINSALAIFAKGAFDGPGGGLFTNPLTYVTVLIALSLIVLTAIAFRSGPITTSSPAMIASTPIFSAIAAMILFGETFSTTPIAIAVIIVCVIVVAVGVIALTQSEAVHAALDDSVEAELGDNELEHVERVIHDDVVKTEERLHLRHHDQTEDPESAAGKPK